MHRKYFIVGFILLLLTVATVAANKLHAGVALAVFIALLIATLKGSLVASFFMHLVSERKAVLVLLVSTLFLFIVMMGLILIGRFDVYEGLQHVP